MDAIAERRIERMSRFDAALGLCKEDAQTGLYYTDRLSARADIRRKIGELRLLETEQQQVQKKLLGFRAELEALKASQNGHVDPKTTSMLQALEDKLDQYEERSTILNYRLGALDVLINRLADTGDPHKVDRIKNRQQVVKEADWQERTAVQRMNNAREKLATARRDSPPESDAVRKAEREVTREKMALTDIQTRRMEAQDEIDTLRAELIEEE